MELDRDGRLAGHEDAYHEVLAQGDRLVTTKMDLVAKRQRLQSGGGFIANRKLGGSSEGVYYTADLRHGLRVITVHSAHKFVNATAERLALMLRVDGRLLSPSTYPYDYDYDAELEGEGGRGGESEAWAILDPNSSIYMPLVLNAGEQRQEFYVRPVAPTPSSSSQSSPGDGAGDSKKKAPKAQPPPPRFVHGWARINQNRALTQSQRQLLRSPATREQQRHLQNSYQFLRCKGAGGPSGPDFHLNVEGATDPETSLQCYRFLPVVVMKSLLPDPVEIEWGRGHNAGARAEVEVVAPGGERDLHTLDPSEAFTVRLRLRSIGGAFSRPVSLPPAIQFIRDAKVSGSGDGASSQRRCVSLSIYDGDNNELRLEVELKITALKVMVCVSAPYWIFDTTGLNLSVSEDRKRLCPKRIMHGRPEELKTLEDEGQAVEHAEMFSFSAASDYPKFFIHSNPHPASKPKFPLPRCPGSVTQGKQLDGLAYALKGSGSYTFQRSERLLYHYSRMVLSVGSCTILTTKAIASIDSKRLQKTVLLHDVLRAVHKRSGPLNSDQLVVLLKDGSRTIFDMWAGDAVHFFAAMVNYICNQSLQGNNVSIMRSDWSQDPITADSVGTVGALSLKALHSTMTSRYKAQYEVGYSITTGSGPWRQVAMISLVPRYFVMNNTEHWIEIHQKRTVVADTKTAIKPEGSQPFHWPCQDAVKLLRFRCKGPADGTGAKLEEGWKWSSYFPVNKPSDHKIRVCNTRTLESKTARVEVRSSGPTLFVVVSFIEGASDVVLPYRVENRCTLDAFHVRQIASPAQNQPGDSCAAFRRNGWINVQPHTHVPFAVDDVTMPALFEVALDEDHSDSRPVDNKGNGKGGDGGERKGAGLFMRVDLSKGPQKKQKWEMSPTWHGSYTYPVHVFVVHDGPVKVIVISKEEPYTDHVNPFELTPLRGHKLAELERRIQTLDRSVAENGSLRLKYAEDLKHALGAPAKTSSSRRRPASVGARESVLQLQVISVAGVRKSQLYCYLEFGRRQEKVSVGSGSSPMVHLDLDQAREGTLLRITLMSFNPMWTDECLGVVEVRLGDFRDHRPVYKRFPLKPCVKESSQSLAEPWVTPPSSRSSARSVSGELALDVWWVPMESQVIRERMEAVAVRLRHRKRVIELLKPTQEISVRYTAYFEEQKRKLIAKHLNEREATEAALQLIEMGDARFTIRLLGVRGRALSTYNLTAKNSTARLCCVVTVNAMGQSTCSVLCENGRVVVNEWLDHVSFDLPQAFLAKAAKGDQRGRARVTIYVEDRAKSGVGYEVVKLGEASLPLSDVKEDAYASQKRSLAEYREFATDFKYDTQRAESPSWADSNYRWVTIRRNTADEVSLLVFCQREQGGLMPERSNTTVALALPRLGLSLIDRRPRELLYFSISDTLVLHRDSTTQAATELCVGKIQIDNQLEGYSFPFILCPRPVPYEQKKQMLQVSINRSKDNPGASNFTMAMGHEGSARIVSHEIKGDAHPIREVINPQYNQENALHNNLVLSYVDFLLQEFELNLEENLYWELLSYLDSFRRRSEGAGLVAGGWVQPSYKIISDTYNIPPANSQLLTIGLLKLQSMALKVSFEISPGLRKKGLILDLPFDPTAVLMSFFGSTLGSIQDMNLRLDSIMMQNVHTSTQSMVNSLIHHYKTDILAQWYKVVFGLQIIGNPVGALENMADGVMSFFLEPAKGMVEDPGVLGFSRGVAKGSKALLESTISSTFGVMGNIAGSVGKGLAVLSMDDEFIERNKQTNNAEPRHIGEGLFSGAKSVGMGVFGGISGIIMDPIAGAKKEGVGGFFKGAAKGVLGVVTKPTAGVINATSQTLRSVGNTATMVLAEKTAPTIKVRPPLYVPENSVSLPLYSYPYSLGSFLLRQKGIMEELTGVAITNDAESQIQGTYAMPRVRSFDVKSPTKERKWASEATYVVMMTKQRVLVQSSKSDGEWQTVANIKVDRIKSVHDGKGETNRRWGVQILEKNKQPVAIWCTSQMEAAKLRQKLSFHLDSLLIKKTTM